jgi:hypothetical protein
VAFLPLAGDLWTEGSNAIDHARASGRFLLMRQKDLRFGEQVHHSAL